MRLKDIKTSGPHPTEFFPLVVNRTLPEEEQQKIRDHISECPSCRMEFSRWETLSSAVKGDSVVIPDINSAWSSMERRIKPDRKTSEEKASPSFIRRFFPSLAWGIVALQGIIIIGFAVYLLIGGQERDLWRTLGGKTTVMKRDDVRLQVVFQQDAKASDIADLLSKVEGQIVGGPSNQGVFEVSIPLHIVKKNSMDSILKLFRQRTDVVRWVQTDETI